MKRICLFAASAMGARPSYADAAAEFGHTVASRGIGLVYGGCCVGLMKIAANAALAAGGEVIGVIPEALVDLEIAHRGLTELKIVGSMHERKATMAELSDGFAALPGGLGTLEETFEVLTWSQLGFHKKPCGLLNIDGYYDQLLAFLDHCVEQGLLRAPNRKKILAEANTEALLERFASYEPAESEKWLRRLSEL
jgi:uncharacterized protein (TIGR00730 family)